jgi:cathepsin F
LRIPDNITYNYVANYTDTPEHKSKQAVPDIFNWEQMGAVTGIKNQGTCGSCWSFSTAGNIEGLYYLQYGELLDFSEQQLIDCDKFNFGCNGGWPYNAIDWLSKHGGI